MCCCICGAWALSGGETFINLAAVLFVVGGSLTRFVTMKHVNETVEQVEQ